MKASEEVSSVYEKARVLLDEKEEMYGDSWRRVGTEVVLAQVFRKAQYLRIQSQNRTLFKKKFLEDLLDLMNWCAFSYILLEEEHETGS